MQYRKQPRKLPRERASTLPQVQKFFAKCFKAIVWLDTFRYFHPICFAIATSVVTFALVLPVTHFIPFDKIPTPQSWPTWNYISPANLARFIVSLLVSLLLTQILARALLPVLFYVPQALAMKNLGLLYVSTDPDECAVLFHKAAEEHSAGEKVRVICISGRYLFREEKLPGEDGWMLPLHRLALEGGLEVIMPVSSTTNPTIMGRYDTYSPEFKTSNAFPNIEKFIEMEVDTGKDFLVGRQNALSEHNILCMWRVVIFSEHCLVQNYFPNVSKSESYRAPLFMYSKRIDGTEPNSYYDTFVGMFEMIKKVSNSVPVRIYERVRESTAT